MMEPDDRKYTGKGGGGRLSPNRKGERRGGRKKGTPNKMSPAMKRAIIQAASEEGDEYNGQGLLGYLRMLAAEHPDVFVRITCQDHGACKSAAGKV